jgi:hypothetical protein
MVNLKRHIDGKDLCNLRWKNVTGIEQAYNQGAID